MRYTTTNVIRDFTINGPAASVTIPASQTAGVLTGNAAQDAFTIPALFACNWLADVVISATTVAAGVTLQLQTRFSVNEAWQNTGAAITVANAFTGVKTFRFLAEVAGDQGYVPLRPQARIIAITGAGDSITCTAVYVPAIA